MPKSKDKDATKRPHEDSGDETEDTPSPQIKKMFIMTQEMLRELKDDITQSVTANMYAALDLARIPTQNQGMNVPSHTQVSGHGLHNPASMNIPNIQPMQAPIIGSSQNSQTMHLNLSLAQNSLATPGGSQTAPHSTPQCIMNNQPLVSTQLPIYSLGLNSNIVQQQSRPLMTNAPYTDTANDYNRAFNLSQSGYPISSNIPIISSRQKITPNMLQAGLLQAQNSDKSSTQPNIAGNQTLGLLQAPAKPDDLFVPTSSVESLNSTLVKLLGKKENTFTLASTSLDRGISDNLRLKIWNNKFVNFLDLVSRSDSVSDDKDGLDRAPRGPKINSHPLWAKAFAIYHSIYVQRFPELSASLCQYGEFIRELHHNAPNTYIWRTYDETFRFQRQGDLKEWGKIDTELWMQLTTFKDNTSKKPNMSSSPYNNSPSGNGKSFQKSSQSYNKNSNKNSWIYEKCLSNNICFKFSQLNSCKHAQCRYKHICYHCFGKHAGKNCSSSSANSKAKSADSKN